MDPSDESPQDASSASGGTEEAALGGVHEPVHVEPEVGAAIMLSGNYSKSLADRVFSGLTSEEVQGLGQGLLRIKGLSEEQFEHVWNHLTPLFTGDWREEEDLVEFIRSILRNGIRVEPALTPVQKLALLLLALHEEAAIVVHKRVIQSLGRGAVSELTREMAHLMHYPANSVQERVLGEFLGYCVRQTASHGDFVNIAAMEMEADRLVRRHDLSCADLVDRLWLGEKIFQTRLNLAASLEPERTARLYKRFAFDASSSSYIPLEQRAAIFRVSLSPEATELLDAALALEPDQLPEPIVSSTRKQLVLREFLTRYYIDNASQVPLVLQ